MLHNPPLEVGQGQLGAVSTSHRSKGNMWAAQSRPALQRRLRRRT